MADLEQLLLNLSAFGRPRLFGMSGGWHCNVDMFVQATGATVQVNSDFNHPSPSIAAQACLDRVSAVVRDISKLADNKALTHG